MHFDNEHYFNDQLKTKSMKNDIKSKLMKPKYRTSTLVCFRRNILFVVEYVKSVFEVQIFFVVATIFKLFVNYT